MPEAFRPELIDENLRTDINWIRRLTLSLTNAKEMLDALVIDDELSYNVSDLSSKFNKKKFFEKEFYPVSLFTPTEPPNLRTISLELGTISKLR